jgi:quercetin dioxygenase-like cupin family protein/DNA-binding XRE family transcriptional regulator
MTVQELSQQFPLKKRTLDVISETLSQGLEAYRIGPKIRSLRLRKGLGLVQLGQHSGLSAGLLSKIERGQLIPTLPTLLRIALVFGVGLEHFFAESDEGPHYAVTRKAERLQLPNLPGTDPVAYRFESLDFPLTERKMEAFYVEFPTAGAVSQPHHHDGTELVYVIKGELTIILEEVEIALSEGDAITFESETPHAYRREGRSLCAAVVVVRPA